VFVVVDQKYAGHAGFSHRSGRPYSVSKSLLQ
jgi:hypothetical protein